MKRSWIRRTPRRETLARKKRNMQKAKIFRNLQSNPMPQEHDLDYMVWIRSKACVITGRENTGYESEINRVDCAHCGGSVGAGGSDYDCLPLHHPKHMEQHKIGELSFIEKYNLDIPALIKEHNERYEKETGKKVERL